MTPLEPSTPGRTYRPDIDGLRALAILSVVLYHVGFLRLSGGFTGVDIFFVISGYLIGGHIWAELRAGSFSYLRFYQRRARRILPAFYAVLALTLAAGLVLLSPGELAQLGRNAVAATLSLSNILFWGTANYFTPRSEFNPLLMTWSLGVEEQFYAVIPLLMVVLARVRRRWILPAIVAACIASFAFAWAELAGRPMLAFYMLPARAWELGTGIVLAVAELNRKRNPLRGWCAETAGWAGLGLMLAPMAVLTSATPFPGPAALPSVAGAALAIAAPSSWVNRRILSALPFRFIGKVSYSWYLCHWPLLALMHILYGGALPPARTAETIAVSFAAAVACYYFIEQPFRRSARPPIPMLARYAAASAGMLVLCAALWLSCGVPRRFPALAAMEIASQSLPSEPCLADLRRDRPNLSPACYDASGSWPLVALWGDSHAAAIAPGIRNGSQAQGYGLVLLAKASCPPLSGATHFIPRIPLLAEGCLRFNRQVLALLNDNPRVRIVILSAVWTAPLYRNWQDGWLTADLARQDGPPTEEATRTLFVASLRAAIESLLAAGKQVVVLEDVPAFEIDPVWRVKSQAIPARRRLALWLGVANVGDPGFASPDSDPRIALSNALLVQALAGLKDAELADLGPALCPASSQCAYRDGVRLLYFDSSHLSTAGAIYAVRNFRLPPIAALDK